MHHLVQLTRIVEYTGRQFRDGSAVISAKLSGVLEEIGSNAEYRWTRVEKLRKSSFAVPVSH